MRQTWSRAQRDGPLKVRLGYGFPGRSWLRILLRTLECPPSNRRKRPPILGSIRLYAIRILPITRRDSIYFMHMRFRVAPDCRLNNRSSSLAGI